MTNPRTVDHLAQLERQRIARDAAHASDYARYTALFAAVSAFPPITGPLSALADFPPAVHAMLVHRQLVEARSKLPLTPINEDSFWIREDIADLEREHARLQELAAADAQRDPADRYHDLCAALVKHPPELDKRGFFPAEVQAAILRRERSIVERADEFELPHHAPLHKIDRELDVVLAQHEAERAHELHTHPHQHAMHAQNAVAHMAHRM